MLAVAPVTNHSVGSPFSKDELRGWALVRDNYRVYAAKDKDEKEVIRELLRHLYLTSRPEKAKDVDGLLEEWEGEERLLLAKVKAKCECRTAAPTALSV